MKRNRCILHVDDDPAIRRLVSETLFKQGYEVFSLDDPRRTTRELGVLDARLVILDIDMPEVDGLTLLREVKRMDGGIQVIMLTGLVSMSTVLQSMRWGAESCLFKPITSTAPLITAVETAFEKTERWWQSLDELKQLKTEQVQAIETRVEQMNFVESKT